MNINRGITKSKFAGFAILLVITILNVNLLGSIKVDAFSLGQVGDFSTTTPIPDNQYVESSVQYNGYVYVISNNDNGTSASVYYSKLNGDGTIGAWQTGTTIPTAITSTASTVNNGYIYTFGGSTNSAQSTNHVYYAAINPDGSVGTWASATNLTTPVYSATVANYNGYVYVLYGVDNGNFLNDVVYAKYNNDGTLGSWAATTGLPDTLFASSAVANNGYLYELGGCDAGSCTANVSYYAAINPDGTIGTWKSTTGLDELSTAAEISNGYIYEFGGEDDNGLTNTVLSSQIQPDGSLGSWQTAATLPDNIAFGGSVIYGNYVYLLGGGDDNGSSQAVYSALMVDPTVVAPTTSPAETTTTPSAKAPDTGFGQPKQSTLEQITTLTALATLPVAGYYSVRATRLAHKRSSNRRR